MPPGIPTRTVAKGTLMETRLDGNQDSNELVLYRESCKAFPRSRPPQVDATVDLDVFFSPEMKAIYPGFDAITRLDDHVAKTPKRLKQNIQSLVEYLMEITSTEYDKARVIIRWVATNITYDLNFLTTGNHPGSSAAQDVLIEGSGVCDGFSNLVLEMCRLADLACEKITGIAKGSGYEIGDDLANGINSKKFRHAWNRIKISNTWFLCDATWASGYPEKVNGKYQYIFHWDEGYFLIPAETLSYSHKPDDNNFALIDKPVTDVVQWTNEARMFPAGCLYKMTSLTPPVTEGCINTDSNRVELKFRSTYKMNFRYTLIDDATDEHVMNSVACITNENSSTLLLRLPRAGLYSVVLFGEPVCLSERSKKVSRDMLLSYKVHTTCASGSPPFPDFTHLLGSLPAFNDGGFRSSATFPIIETEDGYARFTVHRPGGEPIRFNFRDARGTELDDYVFANAYPEKVIFNIRCPKKGEYSLIIFARLNDDQVDKNQFKTGATYLILNKNEQATPLLPYPSIAQWGPNDKLTNLDISLNPKNGSEITCNKGETVFELCFNEKQINISYTLKTKEENATPSKWVCAETNQRGNDVILRFRFRVPVSGFHEFDIFAGKVGAKTNDCIGRWLITVVRPYEGDLFIDNRNVHWGPNFGKMAANGLQVIKPNSSTIYPNDEKSTLIIASTMKRRTGLIFSLKNNSGNDLYEYVLADSVKQNDETILYKIKFHPSETGFYCFDLFCGGGDHLGSWMIDVQKSKQLELPSNDKRPWGPVQNFFDYGFSVVEPESAVISTSAGAESKLTITTGPHGKILGHLNFHDQKDDLKDCFDIAYFTDDEHVKIVTTFKLSKKGYYKFSLFISNTGQGRFDYGGGWLLHCA